MDTDTDDETSAVGEKAVPSPQVLLSESQIITTASTPVVPTPVSSQREPQVKSRPKMTYVDKVPDISMAQGFLPEDKDSLHNTGIPPTYAVRRSGTSSKETSVAVPLTLVILLVQGATSVVINLGIASNVLMMAIISTMALDGGITCLPNMKVLSGTVLSLALITDFQPPSLRRPPLALQLQP